MIKSLCKIGLGVLVGQSIALWNSNSGLKKKVKQAQGLEKVSVFAHELLQYNKRLVGAVDAEQIKELLSSIERDATMYGSAVQSYSQDYLRQFVQHAQSVVQKVLEEGGSIASDMRVQSGLQRAREVLQTLSSMIGTSDVSSSTTAPGKKKTSLAKPKRKSI